MRSYLGKPTSTNREAATCGRAFNAPLEAVERVEANGVIVARLDRFARSVAGAAQAVARLEASGGVLVAVDLGLDTSTPAGKLMRNVLMALAEFELDLVSVLAAIRRQ